MGKVRSEFLSCHVQRNYQIPLVIHAFQNHILGFVCITTFLFSPPLPPLLFIEFFNVDTNIIEGSPANMPPGFEVPPGDLVPLMGGHAWDVDAQPTAATWTEPIWVRILSKAWVKNFTISIPTSVLIIIYPLIHFLLNCC